MDPIVTGAMIGAGANLLGGVLSGSSSRRNVQRQIGFQREMAQHGVEWRVADAKRAGVHPVYALGAALPSAAPIPVGPGEDYGIAAAGQDIGRAVAATQTAEQRAEQQLRVRLAQSQIDENDARAGYYRFLATGGGARPNPPFPAVSAEGGSAPYQEVQMPQAVQIRPGDEYTVPGAFDVVAPKASDQMSARSGAPYIAAGLPPGSKEYRLTPNMAVLLPAANDLGEALEPLSESLGIALMWYKINVQHYGREFTDLAFQEMGLNPSVLKALRLWSRESVEVEREATRRRNWYERQYPGGSEAFRYHYSPSLTR